MNNTTQSSDTIDRSNGLAFGIAFPICLVLICLCFTVAAYLCPRMRLPTNPSHQTSSRRPDSEQNFVAIELGLDEATLHSFPKLLYAQYKLKKSRSTTSCCSICLMDYKETDVLLSLPECGHLFHLKCINPWLRLHPTCPLCRKLPVPLPSTTPPTHQLPPLAVGNTARMISRGIQIESTLVP